ncbi:MAG: M14 family zinc carboxypeptidase [Anaerolineaceae bacterium]|jgi:hypothetical protein
MSQPSKLLSFVLILTLFFLTVTPSQAETANINLTIPGFNCYRGSQTIDQRLIELKNTYPIFVQLSEIGNSIEGRPIKLIKITNDNEEINKPRLILISGLRGNSFAPVEINLLFLESLLQNYEQDATATFLLNFIEIYSVVIANPDGRLRAEAQARAGETIDWENNANPNYCASFDNGVRLNLNFSYQWSSGNTDPCSPDYPGLSAASEPETQALVAFLSQLANDSNPSLLLHLDSYQNKILIPYLYDNSVPNPHAEELFMLANKLTYETEAIPVVGNGDNNFESHGTLLDYAYGELELPALSFRMGTQQSGGHTPACWYFNDYLKQATLQALTRAALASFDPYQLAYGPETVLEAQTPELGHIDLRGFSDDYSFYKENITDYSSVNRLTWSLDFPPGHPQALVRVVDSMEPLPDIPFRSTFQLAMPYSEIENRRHLLCFQAWDTPTQTSESRPGLYSCHFIKESEFSFFPLLFK